MTLCVLVIVPVLVFHHWIVKREFDLNPVIVTEAERGEMLTPSTTFFQV